MPGTTPAPHSLPYPTGGDAVSGFPAKILELVNRLAFRGIHRGKVTVNVSGAGSAVQAVAFPAGLYASGVAPVVNCQVVGTGVWSAFPSGISNTGCNITIRHNAGGTGSGAIEVHYYVANP